MRKGRRKDGEAERALFAMGDLKTTPMQTPRESCPPSTGRFNIAAGGR